jgi:hypothetical protein
VPLNIELSRPLRSATQLRNLVQAVFDAHESDEQHYIEWKGTLDLGKSGRQGHFSIAKCIIAMANRPVESSRNYFGGCGYMIIGAEPKRLHNITVPDMADLEPWINRYTGDDGPTWSGHTVQIGDSMALVIVVEPPADGDHIHTLARDWESHKEGTIFVRHQARSEPMNAADLRALERRLMAGSTGPTRIHGVTIATNGVSAIQVMEVTQEDINAAVDKERDALVPASTATSRLMSAYDPIAREDQADYLLQCERYLTKFKNALPQHVLRSALERRQGRLRVAVTNTSRLPVSDLRVVLRFSGDVLAFEEALDVDGDLPTRPISPHKSTFGGFPNVYTPVPRMPDLGLLQKNISVSRDNREVTLRIPSLHPSETSETDSFVLFVVPGSEMNDADRYNDRTATVLISAGDRAGVQESTLSLDNTGTTWKMSDLY